MKEKGRLRPLIAAGSARTLWLLTLYICNGIDKDKIPYAMFQQALTIQAGGRNIRTIKPVWQQKHIKAFKENLRISVSGTMFQVFDQELDEVFGQKPNKYSDSDLDALRAIIFMLRCAYSHGTTQPRWKIEGKKGTYERVFSINAIGLDKDFSSLNGELVDLDWAELFDLIDYTVDTIKENEKQP